MHSHQLKAIEILNAKFGVADGQCLADDMGLGKTFTALALYIYYLKCKKIMVVCPGINVGTWEAEFKKFVGFCEKEGGDKICNYKMVVLTNHMGFMERHKELLEFWKKDSPPCIIVWAYS
jgi:SNF2 family DNA or RNA helicase